MKTNRSSRIAKNTLMLYFRMMFAMLANLYISREILIVLGAEDYGIYNIVGGVVTMFSFLRGTLNGATSRFLSFEQGRENSSELNKVFNTAVSIHIIVSVIVLIIAETIGLWFVVHYLVIDVGRINAALVVYHLSVVTCVLQIVQMPYNASITSNEDMSIYAYISIVEVLIKLSICYLLLYVTYDKLIYYAGLVLLLNIIVTITYIVICKKRYEECDYNFTYDKKKLKPMLYFAGWDLYGNMSWMFATQGINVLLNMFFGAIINASSSIAFQVRNVVSGFSNNITTAVSPQIIKSYANNDLIYMNKLIIQSAKFSFLLLYLISLPLIIENEFILNLWLKDVPKYTKEFCQLNLIYGLISALFYPVITGIYAVGEMKRVSFITGTIYLISLPITYTLLKLNYSPLTPFIVSIFILLFACLYNQTIIKKYVKSYSISYFFKEVVFKCLIVVVFSSIIPLTLSILLTQGWVRLILVGLGSTSSVAITTYYIAIDEKLQHKVVFKIKNSFQYFYEVICYRLTIKI